METLDQRTQLEVESLKFKVESGSNIQSARPESIRDSRTLPTTYNLQPSTSNSSLKSPISSLLVLLFLTLGYTGWGQTNFYYKGTGNVTSVSSWGTNTDGTGTAPVNFTTNKQIFNLRNAASITLDASWTISGNNSKLVVGNGTDACNFIVPGLLTVSTVATDVSNNGTITRSTSGANSWGTLNVLAGGRYIHNVNGGTLPTATWDAASTLQLDQRVNDNLFGGLTLGNLVISSGVTAFTMIQSTGSSLTIGGDFTFSSSNIVTISQRGTGVTLNISGNMVLNGTGTLYGTDQFNNNAVSPLTLNVTGNYSQSAGTFIYSNYFTSQTMTVSGNFSLMGGNFRVSSYNNTTSGRTYTVDIGGNYSQSGGVLNLGEESNSSNLVITNFNVSGNFSHTAGTITESAGTACITRISLQGTASSTFTTTGQSNSVQFIINKTGTATNDIVTLSANSNISSNLTLTDGLLSLSTFNLTLAATATITAPGSTASLIVPTESGELRKIYTSTGSFVFPIGDNTGTLEYSPVTVNVTAGSGFSSAYVGVSLEEKKHNNNFSTTNFLTRSWIVTQSGITGCTATITGTYINTSADVSGTLGSIRAAQLNGTFNQQTNPWLKTGGAVLSGTTLTYTGATITAGQASVFTGITSADPTVSITEGNQNACQNASVTLTANPTGDAAFTYQWSSSLGTNSTATPPTSSVGSTSYTVTVKDANGISSAASAAVTVTVTAPPNAGTLSGSQAICVGGSTTFTSNGNIGGAWTTSDAAVATVNSTTGAISGVAAGTATITYTVTGTGGCSNATATRTVTVNALPTLPTGTNGSRCGTGTVSISATAGAGETIDWYAAASGGIALSNGSTSFTTP
ncbi:MAG: hypothetical protein KGP35_08575, partial [Bacteroidetes bacterium]|nr:hypothetical protein [Bacteroidota bacterium]